MDGGAGWRQLQEVEVVGPVEAVEAALVAPHVEGPVHVAAVRRDRQPVISAVGNHATSFSNKENFNRSTEK